MSAIARYGMSPVGGKGTKQTHPTSSKVKDLFDNFYGSIRDLIQWWMVARPLIQVDDLSKKSSKRIALPCVSVVVRKVLSASTIHKIAYDYIESSYRRRGARETTYHK